MPDGPLRAGDLMPPAVMANPLRMLILSSGRYTGLVLAHQLLHSSDMTYGKRSSPTPKHAMKHLANHFW